jgi:hypothetical protein
MMFEMIDPSDYADTGPTCFVQHLDSEYRRIRNKHMRFLFRYHLSKYPIDLVQFWWRKEGAMPWVTSLSAFKVFKAGAKAADFRLYKGPSHFPKFALVDGGKSGRPLTLGKR